VFPLVDGTRTYRLHDLLHDLARNLLTAPSTPKRRGDLPGLGLKLVDAHSQFLEKYCKKTKMVYGIPYLMMVIYISV
jgi:hypothetical protein